MRATRDSRYGDSMERVLYNCILGAKPIEQDGHGFYYSDYNNDGSKVYHPYKWHCCTGTFSQVTADYGISSYFHDGEGIVCESLCAVAGDMEAAERAVACAEDELSAFSDFAIEIRCKAQRFRCTCASGVGRREDSGPVNGKRVGKDRAGQVCPTASHVEEWRSCRD